MTRHVHHYITPAHAERAAELRTWTKRELQERFRPSYTRGEYDDGYMATHLVKEDLIYRILGHEFPRDDVD